MCIFIYIALQESGRQRNSSYPEAASGQYVMDDHYVSSAMAPQTGSLSSPSGGLACAIAALAERQQTGGESSTSTTDGNISSFNILQGANRFYNRLGREPVSYPPTDDISEVPLGGALAMNRSNGEWDMDHRPQVAESASSYTSSVAADGSRLPSLPQPDDIEGSLENGTDPIVPESFEEQMMLAMAVSLAEARAMSNGQSVSWQ